MTSHRTRGLYRLLERPRVYEWLQNLLGARNGRRRIVELLRPFAGARVLDIGCGTGTLLENLPADVEYTGFDLNPAYIDIARKLHGERARFICARVGETELPGEEQTYDFVLAIALLHHLDDADAHRLLDTAARLLRPGGVFFSIDGTLHEKQSRIARLLIALDRGAKVRTPDAYRRLIDAHFASGEDWLLTDLMPVPYSHYAARATGPRRPSG